MRAYIKGLFTVSPPYPRESGFQIDPSREGYRSAEAPDYRQYIDPRLSRRMARIIKMGVAAAKGSLEEAGTDQPGAILVGTGLGCLEDTEKFLADIIGNNEGLLSPTAFIQSTHNTIAGQIALVLRCNRHNFTYVQRGHSFENALGDALLQLEDGVEDVLVGGIDEVTPTAYTLLKSLGCTANTLGEGASFFVLSSEPGQSGVCIEATRAFYQPGPVQAVVEETAAFLAQAGMHPGEVDAIMMGCNGTADSDIFYDAVKEGLMKGKPVLRFKNFCGEYFTASAFGHYLSARVLLEQKVWPVIHHSGPAPTGLRTLLFYNHYGQKYHTLTLFATCRPS